MQRLYISIHALTPWILFFHALAQRTAERFICNADTGFRCVCRVAGASYANVGSIRADMENMVQSLNLTNNIRAKTCQRFILLDPSGLPWIYDECIFPNNLTFMFVITPC